VRVVVQRQLVQAHAVDVEHGVHEHRLFVTALRQDATALRRDMEAVNRRLDRLESQLEAFEASMERRMDAMDRRMRRWTVTSWPSSRPSRRATDPPPDVSSGSGCCSTASPPTCSEARSRTAFRATVPGGQRCVYAARLLLRPGGADTDPEYVDGRARSDALSGPLLHPEWLAAGIALSAAAYMAWKVGR
jgi:hypothetical protein